MLGMYPSFWKCIISILFHKLDISAYFGSRGLINIVFIRTFMIIEETKSYFQRIIKTISDKIYFL